MLSPSGDATPKFDRAGSADVGSGSGRAAGGGRDFPGGGGGGGTTTSTSRSSAGSSAGVAALSAAVPHRVDQARYRCPEWMRQAQPGERWTVSPINVENILKRLNQQYASHVIRNLGIGCEIHHTIARFLIARLGDEAKALEMLEKTLLWRHTFGAQIGRPQITVDDVIGFTVANQKKIRRCHPHGWQGYDKEGRLVYIVRAGLTDTASMMRDLDVDDLLLCHVQSMEFQNRVLLRPEGSPPDLRRLNGVTVICDLTGLGVHNMSAEIFKVLKIVAQMDQDNYPENLAKMFFVNAPIVFHMFWRLFRNFLDERVRQKIRAYSGLASHMPCLLEILDIDQIPLFLGGEASKDHEYWSGGYQFGRQHSSHIAMDEYIEHHERLGGHTRIAAPNDGCSQARQNLAARVVARHRDSLHRESEICRTTAHAPSGTALARAPAFLQLGEGSLLLSYDLVWPWLLTLPCALALVGLHWSRTVARHWASTSELSFVLVLATCESVGAVGVMRAVLARVLIIAASRGLQVTMLQSSAWRAVLFLMVLVPTWQCVAIAVLTAQRLCEDTTDAAWTIDFVGAMTAPIVPLFADPGHPVDARSRLRHLVFCVTGLLCPSYGNDQVPCWHLAAVTCMFGLSCCVATLISLSHFLFGSNAKMCGWILLQLELGGIAIQTAETHTTTLSPDNVAVRRFSGNRLVVGASAAAAEQPEPAAAQPVLSVPAVATPVSPLRSVCETEVQGRVWQMRRKQRVDPHRTMVRKEVWLVIGRDRLEVFKNRQRTVNHYSMDLCCVQVQELTAVLYGFTVSDGHTTIILEAGSTEEMHEWLQNIGEAAKRSW